MLVDEAKKDGHRENQQETFPLDRREIERLIKHHLRVNGTRKEIRWKA